MSETAPQGQDKVAELIARMMQTADSALAKAACAQAAAALEACWVENRERASEYLQENQALQAENARLMEELRARCRFWECPECSFGFDERHTDEGGGYSCPLCAEDRLGADNARLRDALSNFTDGASHTRVFLVSREKMHPNGVALYDQAVAFARTALTEPGL